MGKLRIIGGIYRSRILSFNDENMTIRPTLNRVRETLFNWLGQDLTNKNCLDLFSGSGALAFESVSRNASYVYAIENNYKVYLDLLKNKTLLNCKRLYIDFNDALYYLQNFKSNIIYDVIFLDPPFSSGLLEISLNLILTKSILSAKGVIYIEYSELIKLDKFNVLKYGKAGVVNYALISPYNQSV